MTLDDDKLASGLSVEMEEEAEYKRQLGLFSRSSTEKGIELLKIGEIIAGLKKREKFLDIGAGGGDLTIPISQSFKETAIVEPNEKQAVMFQKRRPGVKVYNDHWEKVDIGKQRFDFILCSHVLYYIKDDKWLSTIEKMHRHLEDGGIAHCSPVSIGEVASFLINSTRYDVNILELWQQLIQRYEKRP